MEAARKDESAERPLGDGQMFNWPMVLLFALVRAAVLALGFIVT